MDAGEQVESGRGGLRPAGPPPLRALDVHGIGVLVIGTVGFAVLTVLALLDRRRLEAAGHGWWLAVAATGIGLGLVVLGYAVRRRRLTHRSLPR